VAPQRLLRNREERYPRIQPNSEGRYPCQHEEYTKIFVTREVVKRHASAYLDGNTFECTDDGCGKNFKIIFEKKKQGMEDLSLFKAHDGNVE